MSTTDSINANDVVAFFVEIAVVVSLGVWAWRQPSGIPGRIGLVVAVIGVAALAWGIFVAPNAMVHQLAAEVILRIVVLGAGVAAFAALVRPWAAAVFAAIVLVNTVLIYVGPFHR